MAILKQKQLDKIKEQHKFLIDNALNEMERVSYRVEKIRTNEDGDNKLGMGFQQNEFAYLLGIPSQNYYRMRKSKKDGGMDIALHHLIKIAVYSGKSLDSIVLGKEHEPKSANENRSFEILAEDRQKMIDILQKNISLLEAQNNDLQTKLDECLKSQE